jgi:hypothetical protein
MSQETFQETFQETSQEMSQVPSKDERSRLRALASSAAGGDGLAFSFNSLLVHAGRSWPPRETRSAGIGHSPPERIRIITTTPCRSNRGALWCVCRPLPHRPDRSSAANRGLRADAVELDWQYQVLQTAQLVALSRRVIQMAKSTGTSTVTGPVARVRNLITGTAVSVTEAARRAAEKLGAASKQKSAPKAAFTSARKSAPAKADQAEPSPAKSSRAKSQPRSPQAKSSQAKPAASAETGKEASPSSRRARSAAPKTSSRTNAPK